VVSIEGAHRVRPRRQKPVRVAPDRRWRAVVAVAALLTSVAPAGDVTSHRVALVERAALAAPVLVPDSPLGATGALAQAPGPDQATAGAGAQPDMSVPQAMDLPVGPSRIPSTALAAYRRAAQILARTRPDCHLDWPLLASIGRIESGHARGGALDPRGTALRPILGPPLDGSAGFAAIPATDGGKWTGDRAWDHAVGPMQFIPATWKAYAPISNAKGYGEADPENVYDAALAAGYYLCAAGGDLRDRRQRAAAVFRYNHSDSYVETVLAWADAYARGVDEVPDAPVAPSIAPPVAAAAPPVTSAATSNTTASPACPTVTASARPGGCAAHPTTTSTCPTVSGQPTGGEPTSTTRPTAHGSRPGSCDSGAATTGDEPPGGADGSAIDRPLGELLGSLWSDLGAVGRG
jgi:membrane-bound lytic murein transglycosylase B